MWKGNLALLYHEQNDVLQPALYAGKLREQFWKYIDSWIAQKITNGNILMSPLPDHNNKFPGSNISNFEQRWSWITADIMPAWQEFESNPANNGQLVQALKKACSACCNQIADN